MLVQIPRKGSSFDKRKQRHGRRRHHLNRSSSRFEPGSQPIEASGVERCHFPNNNRDLPQFGNWQFTATTLRPTDLTRVKIGRQRHERFLDIKPWPLEQQVRVMTQQGAPLRQRNFSNRSREPWRRCLWLDLHHRATRAACLGFRRYTPRRVMLYLTLSRVKENFAVVSHICSKSTKSLSIPDHPDRPVRRMSRSCTEPPFALAVEKYSRPSGALTTSLILPKRRSTRRSVETTWPGECLSNRVC